MSDPRTFIVEFWQPSEVPQLVADGGSLALTDSDGSEVGRIVSGYPEGTGCILRAEVTSPTLAATLCAANNCTSFSRGEG